MLAGAADGSRPVSVHVNVAATLPALASIGARLPAGIIVLAAGVILLVTFILRAFRKPRPVIGARGPR